MTGKEYLLIDAEARTKFLQEGELPDLYHSPWEIDIHVTVNGTGQSFLLERPAACPNLVRVGPWLQRHRDS